MNDEMKEKLSAFIDNEIHDERVVDALLDDGDARAKLTNYRVISDVMRNRYAHSSIDIAAKVSRELDDEATLVAPRKWFSAPKVMQQTAGLAVAATVAAVAILVVGDFSSSPVKQNQVVTVGPITEQPIQMTSAVQKKISGYLVSHNEFSATGKMQGILPYSRIASSPTGQRLVVQTGAKLEK